MNLNLKPRVHGEGPRPAKILIVGEAPGAAEIREGKPIVGAAGQELSRMLHEVGILRKDCRVVNVCPWQPPGNEIREFFFTKTEAAKRGVLYQAGRYPHEAIVRGLEELKVEVAKTQPEVIIALGDVALWALTQETGISKWRGSELTLNPAWEGPYDSSVRVIPTYHPSAVLRSWDWRPVACYDLSRAAKPAVPPPARRWTITTEFAELSHQLQDLRERLTEATDPVPLAADIETRERRFIDCIGIAWSESDAICIPFIRASDYTFLHTPEEEAELIFLLKDILTHPKAQVVGQNWAYDAQYIARQWGFLVKPWFDTMFAHAVAYPGTPKGLDYLSSLYLPYHRYWKDDTAEAEKTADDSIRWEYNCKDCCATWGLISPLSQTLDRLQLWPAFNLLMDTWPAITSMMLRGVRQDEKARGDAMWGVLEQQQTLEFFFEELQAKAFPDVQLAKSKTAKPWYRSPTQQVKLLYEELGFPVQLHKKSKRPTADDSALTALSQKEPLFAPLARKLSDYRTLGVFLSTFIQVRLDHDKRMRCSYGQVGTETFRMNSREDAFGFGGNLQNIPGEK